MDKTTYHASLKKMHEAGVDSHYCHGWASGALQNTALEQQRITEAYSAGYADGKNGETNNYEKWINTNK